MESGFQTGRRFFKAMMPGFKSRLRLPPVFCGYLNAEKNKKATVTSLKGTYELEVQEFQQGRFYFAKGWDEFVLQHGLLVGDIAVFEQTGKMQFNVALYGSTYCEITDFPLKSGTDLGTHTLPAGTTSERRLQEDETSERMLQEDETSESRLQEDASSKRRRLQEDSRSKRRRLQEDATSERRRLQNDAYTEFENKHPRFTTTLTASNVGRYPILYIPGWFQRANRLGKDTRITLQGNDGKRWPAKTKFSRSMGITDGWRALVKHYKLKQGDVCRFELTGKTSSISCVLRVKAFRN